MELKEFFESLPDARRPQGKRIQLSQALWIIFLAIASGYQGYRGIYKFAKANQLFLTHFFNLKHGIPSHVTFRQVLISLDKEAIKQAFSQWASKQNLQAGDWLAADGKALASTVVNTFEKSQDFSATVSLFCQRTGLSVAIADYRNSEQSETEILRQLLLCIHNKGLIVSLDALHTQKKQ